MDDKKIREITYVEPVDYFPKNLRKKHRIGEYAEIKENSYITTIDIPSPDFEKMAVTALEQYLEELEEKLHQLELDEPDEENEEAYEKWEDTCDDLYNRIDDVESLLEELTEESQ